MAQDDDYGYGNTPTHKERKPLFRLPSGTSLLKFDKVATFKLDIIPFRNKEGKAQIGMSYRVHKYGRKGMYQAVCPKHTIGEKCPICDHQFEMMGGRKFKEMSKEEQDTYKSLFPQERSLHNVRLPDGTFRVWDASDFKVKNAIADKAKLFEQELLADGVAGPFKWASPTGGWMVKFDTAEKDVPNNTEGKKFYDVQNFDFKERKEQFDASIVDDMVKLDTIMVIEPYEVLEKIFYSGEGSEEEVADEVVQEVVEDVKPAPKPIETAAKPAVLGKPEVSNASTKVAPKVTEVCPHDGRFGKDFKQLEECATVCDLYVECRRKSQELKAAQVDEDNIPL